MREEENEEAGGRFVRDARQLLRRSAEELDPATLARLQRARQNALAEYDRPTGRRVFGVGWQPALGAAALCATALVAVGLWIGRVPGPAPAVPVAPVSTAPDPAADLEVALDDDNLEMIEDLEFYDWLDSEPPPDPPDAGRAG